MDIKQIVRLNKWAFMILCLTIGLSACDDDTASLGMVDEMDRIDNAAATFNVYTQSLLVDSVLSNSTTSYLGRIEDPETETIINASFAAQFHSMENFRLPNINQLKRDQETGKAICDSIELRLYFDSYYGDINNPMKIDVYPLRKDKILEENTDLYSNTDLEEYADIAAGPIAQKVFTVADYNLPDADRESDFHSDNVRIMLPTSYGEDLLNLYYKHPDYFQDAYSFIRKVCPGFFFKVKNGEGTMLQITVSTINLYFTYHEEEKADSLLTGLCRFAATPEVIQSSSFENGQLSSLLEKKDCTFLKTPSGIYTECELPVNEIFKEHQNDSVSRARLTFTRINNEESSDYSFNIPQSLLMVRKDEMNSFFQNREVANSQTSYTTDYNPTYNTYTFFNIGRLISYCRNEKLEGMKQTGLSEAAWEAKNPNWNKVVLIPVKVSKGTNSLTNSSYQVSVRHDMDLNSIKLIGGPERPLKMQVIYSQFK